MVLSKLNSLLVRLPWNGTLTIRSLVVVAISFLMNSFASDLPFHPSDENIALAVDQLIQGVQLLSSSLELLGLTGVAVGFVRKVVKYLTRAL